jgi:hypothetical protein
MHRLRRLVLTMSFALSLTLPVAAAPSRHTSSPLTWFEGLMATMVDRITAVIGPAGSADATPTAAPPPGSSSTTNSGDGDTGPGADPNG